MTEDGLHALISGSVFCCLSANIRKNPHSAQSFRFFATRIRNFRSRRAFRLRSGSRILWRGPGDDRRKRCARLPRRWHPHVPQRKKVRRAAKNRAGRDPFLKNSRKFAHATFANDIPLAAVGRAARHVHRGPCPGRPRLLAPRVERRARRLDRDGPHPARLRLRPAATCGATGGWSTP